MRCVRIVDKKVTTMKIRSYTELIKYKTFMDRFHYLQLKGRVGETTFGFDRYLNQILYTSPRWRSTRDKVIIRDDARDLGVKDYEIQGRIIVHHMNPITIEDLELERDIVFDPEYLITSSHLTHNAVHFGNEELLPKPLIVRRPNDTRLW